MRIISKTSLIRRCSEREHLHENIINNHERTFLSPFSNNMQSLDIFRFNFSLGGLHVFPLKI